MEATPLHFRTIEYAAAVEYFRAIEYFRSLGLPITAIIQEVASLAQNRLEIATMPELAELDDLQDFVDAAREGVETSLREKLKGYKHEFKGESIKVIISHGRLIVSCIMVYSIEINMGIKYRDFNDFLNTNLDINVDWIR